jgi:Uma2 family endonuclease
MITQSPDRSIPPSDPPLVTWEPLPDDYILPDDPVENNQQPLLAAALSDALGANGYLKPETLVASNFGLVANIKKKIVVKAPDWLYVPAVQPSLGKKVRRSYTQIAQGTTVAIVMEFLSHEDNGELSERSRPPYGKLYFYEKILQVPSYVTYDPYSDSLQVRQLEDGSYRLQKATEQGRFWLPELGLFLGLWQGQRLGEDMMWLRFWNRSGELLLWGAEQADLARQQSATVARQADLERQRADTEQQRADTERQRADTERQRADAERQRADAERQRADAEARRSEALATKLRELGIDPTDVG